MDYFIGIDPASESFVASIFTAADQEDSAARPREFVNAPDGFSAFQEWLFAETKGPQADLLICVEQTGVYSEALCYELHRVGFDLVLLDPHSVWKAFDDDRKTDAIDSQRIAEYGYRYRDRLRTWIPNETVVERIKTLLSTREQLVEQKTATQNTQHAVMRKAVRSPSALDVLKQTTEHLKEQIETLEKTIKRLIQKHPTMAQMTQKITTLPGAGDLLSAHMLVLTNGFTKEPQYRPLASHLGICPNEHQSGTHRRKPTSRGYGPSMMRKLLHLAALSVKNNVDRFAHYFHRKRKEGKPKMVVFNNIANKLLRILCAMIKNEQPYIENYQSVHPELRKAGTRS